MFTWANSFPNSRGLANGDERGPVARATPVTSCNNSAGHSETKFRVKEERILTRAYVYYTHPNTHSISGLLCVRALLEDPARPEERTTQHRSRPCRDNEKQRVGLCRSEDSLTLSTFHALFFPFRPPLKILCFSEENFPTFREISPESGGD